MALNPNQFAHLDDKGLESAMSRLHKRVGKLEDEYGGFISTREGDNGGDSHTEYGGSWAARKRKITNKQDAIREEMRRRSSGPAE